MSARAAGAPRLMKTLDQNEVDGKRLKCSAPHNHMDMRNRLNEMPEELINRIYMHVFASALDELKTYHPRWEHEHREKYMCSNTRQGVPCSVCVYPETFSFRCPSCDRGLCNGCWVRSRRDARSHSAHGFFNWV